MNVGSLFSGIGGLDLGLHRAGHEHVFFCEWDAYRRDVLRTRWPGVSVYEDVRDVGHPSVDGGRGYVGRAGRESSPDTTRNDAWSEGRSPDLLCGGFPCQDLSVAGRRAGLAGNRSGLFFEFARIIDAIRPSWILLENVPGLLSSQGGRDFGVVLGTLADLGYGVAWRILDSRFFGVPQRRRRVFIVGTLADGDPRAAAERAGEILAVGQGCERHLAARGEARKDAAVAPISGLGSGGPDDNDGYAGRLVGTLPKRVLAWGADEAASGFMIPAAVTAEAPTESGNGLVRLPDADCNSGAGSEPQIAAPLTKGSATGAGVNPAGRRQEDDVNIVAFHPTGGGAKGLSESDDVAPGTGTGNQGTVAIAGTLRQHVRPGSNNSIEVVDAIGVRRLTPTECERLQGFPDGWTQLGDTADSKRYSALGDAVTVNVAEWIGGRLAA